MRSKTLDIEPRDAASRRENAGTMFLDVREPSEQAVARIEGAILIPMREIPSRLAEIDAGKEIVVFCHHGSRSAMIANFLRSNGCERAINLAGGIDAWSLEVDPSVPRYR